METGGVCRKRRAFGFLVRLVKPMLVNVERRSLGMAWTGLAANAASQQQLGKTAAMILPRWNMLRLTFG